MTRKMTMIKKTLLVVLMLTFGTTVSWGQTDYSGVYYIGTAGYNAGTPANNYYLCPTEGIAVILLLLYGILRSIQLKTIIISSMPQTGNM